MELLKCRICKNLDPSAKILLCCNSSICQNHVQATCQFCNSPKTITTNWLLNSYLQNSNQSDRCNQQPGKNISSQSSVILCSPCNQNIHSEKTYQKDPAQNQPFDFPNQFSQIHQSEPTFLCQQDFQSCCNLSEQDQLNNSSIPLEQIHTQIQSQFNYQQKSIQELKSQLQKQLQKTENESVEIKRKSEQQVLKIKDRFSYIKKLVQAKQDQLIQQIRDLEFLKTQEILREKTSLSQKFKKTELYLQLLQKAKTIPVNCLIQNAQYLDSLLDQQSCKYTHPHWQVQFPSIITKPLIYSIQHLQLSFNTHQPLTSLQNKENISQAIKFLNKQSDHSSIKITWTPTVPPYILQYGIGSKSNGIQQFRQIYKGKANNCTINDLLPKTRYRFRVASFKPGRPLEWSQITQISTTDPQKLDQKSNHPFITFFNRGNERWAQFSNSSILLGEVPLFFGKHSWQVKVVCSNLMATDDMTGCMQIGVCVPKTNHFIGLDCKYYYTKPSFQVQVEVDLEKMLMKVSHQDHESSAFFAIGEVPVIPAFFHRPLKHFRTQVKTLVTF